MLQFKNCSMLYITEKLYSHNEWYGIEFHRIYPSLLITLQTPIVHEICLCSTCVCLVNTGELYVPHGSQNATHARKTFGECA